MPVVVGMVVAPQPRARLVSVRGEQDEVAGLEPRLLPPPPRPKLRLGVLVPDLLPAPAAAPRLVGRRPRGVHLGGEALAGLPVP